MGALEHIFGLSFAITFSWYWEWSLAEKPGFVTREWGEKAFKDALSAEDGKVFEYQSIVGNKVLKSSVSCCLLELLVFLPRRDQTKSCRRGYASFLELGLACPEPAQNHLSIDPSKRTV